MFYQRLIVSFAAALSVTALVLVLSHIAFGAGGVARSAGAGAYHENPAMAKAIIKESKLYKGYRIYQAECRTANLADAGVSITSDVTECLIVGQNGKKPLFCGILHIPAATATPYLLQDVDYATAAPCATVKAYLAKQRKRGFTA